MLEDFSITNVIRQDNEDNSGVWLRYSESGAIIEYREDIQDSKKLLRLYLTHQEARAMAHAVAEGESFMRTKQLQGAV